MVVDIGGGTTEIAVIALGGIVVSRSLKLAGDDMDQAILHYMRLRHGLLIGEKTAEDIKMNIGSAYEKKIKTGSEKAKSNEKNKEKNEEEKELVDDEEERIKEKGNRVNIIRGRDIETGLPRSLRVSEAEIREALSPILTQIIEGIADVLEETPPELISDVLERGILLTGGGSLLPGLDQLIIERTHMPVILAEDPLTTVVRGTGKVLDDIHLLNRVKIIGGLG